MPRGILTGLALAIALIGLGIAAGCNQQVEVVDGDANLRTLAGLYADFLNLNQGRAPHDQADFRAFIEQHGSKRLELAGARDIDSLFVSTRDGSPLIMLYEGKGGPLAERGIIGYESNSSNGKRSVAYRFGSVEVLDESAVSDAAVLK